MSLAHLSPERRREIASFAARTKQQKLRMARLQGQLNPPKENQPPMNTASNGHTGVIELLEQLRKQKETIERQIEATLTLLGLLGDEHVPDTPGERPMSETASLKGLSVREALVAYARANGNLVECNEAAKRLVAEGVGNYATETSAYSSFYYYLKNDDRFTLIRPGVFSFKDRPVVATTTRDYSLAAIPDRFRKFKLDSIHGKSQPDAMKVIAAFAKGPVTSKEVTALFWHADFCPTAANPGVAMQSVTSVLSKALRRVSPGQYAL